MIPTILIIDNSLSSNLLIQNILKENGFRALAIESADKGLKLISNSFPDMVLLDISLSDIDGYEVLRQIKVKSKGRVLPVIIVSAKKKNKDIRKAFELGADDYIVKPIIINEVIDKVNTALNIKKISNYNILF